MAALDAAAERAPLADEVLLADELVERARPHPGGERLALGRGLEQGFGPGAGDAPGGHGPMVGPRRSAADLDDLGDVDQDARARTGRSSSRIAIRSDVLDVARDVGVLAAPRRRERAARWR